ncbi:hypothetical protein IG631_17662 [Alternaria alternata]|nr:hypothetical protein IG631_17662 [Alternaria alternata]
MLAASCSCLYCTPPSNCTAWHSGNMISASDRHSISFSCVILARRSFALSGALHASCYVVCAFFDACGNIRNTSRNRPTGTARGAFKLSKGAQSQYMLRMQLVAFNLPFHQHLDQVRQQHLPQCS